MVEAAEGIDWTSVILVVFFLYKIPSDDEHKIPQGICCKCCKKLRDSYTFIKQVHKCNSYYLADCNSIINTCLDNLEDECLTTETSNLIQSRDEKENTEIKEENEQLNEGSLDQPKAELESETSSSVGLNDNTDDLPLSAIVDEVKLLYARKNNAEHCADVEIKTEERIDPEVL